LIIDYFLLIIVELSITNYQLVVCRKVFL